MRTPDTTRAGRLRLLMGFLLAVVGSLGIAAATPAWAGAATVRPVYHADIPYTSVRFSPSTAGALVDNHAVLYADGSAYAFVTTTSVTHRLLFEVAADQCEGAPVLGVAVDGVTYLTREIDGVGDYAAVGTWAPGRHQVSFRFLNDHHTTTCDRNLRVVPTGLYAYADGSVWVADTFQLWRGTVADVDPASAGRPATYGGLTISAASTVTVRQDSQGARELDVHLGPDTCQGAAADVTLSLDGTVLYDGPVTGYAVYPGSWANGVHTVTLTFSGMLTTASCDRDVTFDELQFVGKV